jgi:hypothetical protein
VTTTLSKQVAPGQANITIGAKPVGSAEWPLICNIIEHELDKLSYIIYILYT